MKKTLLLLSFLTAVSSQGASTVLDYTNPGPGDTSTGIATTTATTIVYNGVTLGGGTGDVTLSTGGGNLNTIAVGVGVAGGGQGNRIGDTANEVITLTFSNLMGVAAADIQFVGLVASTIATSGVFTFGAGDALDVNGTALTGDAAGDGAGPTLAYTLDTYVLQNAASPVALNASDAFVLDLTTEAGSGYRLQGIHLEVIPEPSSALLSGLALVGFLGARRRK